MIVDPLYLQDVKYAAQLSLPWGKLTGSSIMVTGASGLIGSFLIDVLMYQNQHIQLDCEIYAVGRSENHARQRFGSYWDDPHFHFFPHDINLPLDKVKIEKLEYLIHLASNTHPVAYATDPIGTITANIIGTNNLLKFAVSRQVRRFMFASSNEIYGENRGDVELFAEDYCGYLDSNTLRAGYSESKRCGEALCQAYAHTADLDVVIPRLTRTYGPTMRLNDSKAIAQFLKKGLTKENIVLKSAGKQQYSFTYVADAVAGLLTVLLEGRQGEAYNIADLSSNISLKKLAQLIAQAAQTKVVFAEPNKTEKAGFSKATKAMLDGNKLCALGWHAHYSLSAGVERTLKILS
ncbi:MAG: NAD-dependent epimerase/dehydratase family protein [Liquorilactobacillus nagelii]